MTDMMKITLNRAALERLIGGDREIELILSHNAVQTVIGQHMGMITDKIGTLAKQITETALSEAVTALLGRLSRRNGVDSFVPSTALARSILTLLEPLVVTKLGEIVAAHFAEIDEKITQVAEAYTRGEIERRLQSVVAAAMVAVTRNP